MRQTVERADLEALLDKYRELHQLREERAETGEVAPRFRLRTLANRFPGALRELDRLPLEAIEQRIEGLETALQDPSSVQPWMPVMLAWHQAWQDELRGKRKGVIEVDREATGTERVLEQVVARVGMPLETVKRLLGLRR